MFRKFCAIAFIGVAAVLFTSSSVLAGHSAATLDDTGSIFDENPDPAPRPTPAPVAKDPPPKPKPVTPAKPNVVPVKPAPLPKPKPAPAAETPKTPPAADAKPAHPSRLVVPEPAARAESLKLIRELYHADYAKTAPADQRSLAQRMLDQSRELTDDTSALYVLLSEASNRAAVAGDGPLAMKAVRGLAKTFQADGPSAAIAALTLAARANVPADQLIATARTALDFSREATAADELQTAGTAVDIAQNAAKRAKDLPLQKVLKLQADRVAELRRGADAVEDFAARLKSDPNDAEACLAVGKYRCLVRGDWTSGMRLLSRSNDPSLKTLATKDIELRQAASAANELVHYEQATEMADSWWVASEQPSVDAALKAGLQTRACYWLAHSAAEVSGIRRVSIEKRINKVRLSRLKPGLEGHFYNNHRFSHQVLERVDPQINFDWREASPAAGVNADGFAAWWRGYIKAPTPGKYKIIVDHDDACRLFIDGKQILENGSATTDRVEVELSTDPQTIEVDYNEATGPARIGLGWSLPGLERVVPIPASAFFHEPPGPLKIPLPRPVGASCFNGHSYLCFGQVIPWYAAKRWCEDMGGHLAFIESADEQAFVVPLVAGRPLWIGLTDEEEEGVWRWADGRLTRFFSWGPQDPNEGELANFVTEWESMWADTGEGGLGFVCEWDD